MDLLRAQWGETVYVVVQQLCYNHVFYINTFNNAHDCQKVQSNYIKEQATASDEPMSFTKHSTRSYRWTAGDILQINYSSKAVKRGSESNPL